MYGGKVFSPRTHQEALMCPYHVPILKCGPEKGVYTTKRIMAVAQIRYINAQNPDLGVAYLRGNFWQSTLCYSSPQKILLWFPEVYWWIIKPAYILTKWKRIDSFLFRHRYALPSNVFFVCLTYFHLMEGTTTEKKRNKLLFSRTQYMPHVVNVSLHGHTPEYLKNFSRQTIQSLYDLRLICIYNGPISSHKDTLIEMLKLQICVSTLHIQHSTMFHPRI